MPPELNERDLDRMVEADIEWAREAMKCMICESGELDADGYCGSCGGKTL